MKNCTMDNKDFLIADALGMRCIRKRAPRIVISVLSAALLMMSAMLIHAEESRTGLMVTVPNGYANLSIDDLSVQSTGGAVPWMRYWDGQEWKFNPYWESLSQSWRNLTGSQTADTTGSTVSSSGGTSGSTSTMNSSSSDDGCWVWVDEDWTPSEGTEVIGGIPQAGPMMPERITPFNRIMGESSTDYAPAVLVSVDYASLCVGVLQNTAVRDLEGIRRENELYLGEQGRYAFSNRAILEKRAVKMLPTSAASALQSQLASGTFMSTPVTNEKGYRWIHKEGDWIDYNTQGQVVAYGDKNDNVVWLVRDTTGKVYGVVDANGRVLYTLHYTNALLTEVRDYPIPGNSLDLPTRSVKYQYDTSNRLTLVTDARGYITRYDYDGQNHIVKVTDQEGRIEQLAYSGDEVVKRTSPDGSVTDYVFDYDDSNKQYASTIKGPATSAGRRTEDYTHNKVGKVVRRIVNGRIEEEVRYDTGARAELHTNTRGFTTKIVYNEFEQVIQVDQADGTTVKHSYSALHLQPTEDTDELGIKTRYEYDSKGNLLKKIEAAGTADERIFEYETNSLGQVTKFTLKGRTETNGTVTADAVWQIEYDSQGEIKKTIDPEGAVRQYSYDRVGNLVSYTDPLNRTTRYEVDAAGNLTKMIDALGRTELYVYDKVGNTISYTDARGKATQAAYDALNRNTQTINPVGGTRALQYNAQGLPVTEVDEDGRTSHAEFDAFLQMTKQVDALGNITEYAYTIADGSDTGAVGSLYQPTEIKYPTYTEQQRYDQLERPTTQTLLNPTTTGTEGLVSSAAYDKRGRVKSDTDANGKTHFYAYDNLGQLLEMTDSLGNKTAALYDARGNLIQIKDAKGNVNRFEFDRNDRVVKDILPLGQTSSYQYDAAGNLTQRIDPNGHKAVYDYDAANRLKEVKQYKANTTLVRTTAYTWDDADNLIAWTDTDATRPSGQQAVSGSATYDDADRKTGESTVYPNPAGGAFTLSYSYQYSAAGYKTKIIWPDGTEISYSYSAHGELESASIPGEGSISANQYKWLAPTQVTLPGGTTQNRTYDGLLNLQSLKIKAPNQQTVLDVANTYGKVQELKTSNRTDTANGGSTVRNSTFTYDDEVRLTQAAVDGGNAFGTDTESFTLDAVGNRVAHSRVAGAWTYDANNRLLQKGTGANATAYQYDEAGNLTQKAEPGSKTTHYSYDTQNRLIEVKDGSGNLIARYGYAPTDVRVWKEQYRDGSGNALSQPKRTYYLYSDEGLIAEAQQAIVLNADQSVSTNSVPQLVAQYGLRPDAEFSTDVLFVKTQNSNGQLAFAYYHNDQLGTPIQATDKSGNLVWAASYSVFGQATITTPAATVDKPTITSNLRLPGQYADEETGLHYNNRRYYDPDSGRYISQDPIGLAGGDNVYRYAEADPINQSDPTGECPQCAAFAACMAGCGLATVAENYLTGQCSTLGGVAGECALKCAAGLGVWNLLKLGSKGWDRLKRRDRLRCAVNSFSAGTLVHVKPADAHAEDAQLGKTDLKPIIQVNVGDEVLAYSEWEDVGNSPAEDKRLSYQKVTDVYTSHKEQTIVHLTLGDGEVITATEGHPFMTTDGWRDAILLKKGGKLLLKRESGDADKNETLSVERTASIVDVKTETKALLAFNLEVANGHTYFVGQDGQLVHNACNNRQTRKRIDSLTKNIKEHVDKIKNEPDSVAKKHWEKEIRNWEREIDRLRDRLPNRK